MIKETVTATVSKPLAFTGSAIFTWLSIHLNLSISFLTVLSVLFVIDIVTGVGKSFRLGIKPTSKRFNIGLEYKLLVLCTVFVLAITAQGLSFDATVLLLIVLNAFLMSEAYSIVANLYTMFTKIEVEEFDVFPLLFKSVRVYLTRFLKADNV